MSSTFDCYFVRHGETDWNAENRIQGHQQVSINQNGVHQAKQLGEKLSSFNFTKCYSSDLVRARETAEIVTEGRSFEVFLDQRLRERDVGSWVGANKDAYDSYFNRDGRGIETDDQMQKRIREFILEISKNIAAKNNVLVVTHGGVIRVLVGELQNRNATDIKVMNTAILHLSVQKDHYTIISFEGIS